jgi:hypothetical protein
VAAGIKRSAVDIARIPNENHVTALMPILLPII